MDKAGAEAIIDTIKALIKEAETLDAPAEDGTIDTILVLKQLRRYMGEYLGVKDPLPPSHLLTARNLTNCKNYLTTNPAGYFVALELLDIDTWPLDCLIQVYRERDLHTGNALFSRVTNFVSEMKQWVNSRTLGKTDVFSVPRAETTVSIIPPKTDFLNVPRENQLTTISEADFFNMFEKTYADHRRQQILAHIKEVATEKRAHTYLGAFAAASKKHFSITNRDFTKLTTTFLLLAGLDPSLAANLRETKIGKANHDRATAEIKRIDNSHAPKN